MNAASSQFDKEEHIKSLQPDGLHSKEGTCQNLLLVMRPELAPTQRAIADRHWDYMMPVEYVANGRAGDLEAQLEKLTLYFAVSPARIFFG